MADSYLTKGSWDRADVARWFCEEIIAKEYFADNDNDRCEREEASALRIALNHLIVHDVAGDLNGLQGMAFNDGPAIYRATLDPAKMPVEIEVIDAPWMADRPNRVSLEGVESRPISEDEFNQRRTDAQESDS